MVTMGDRFEPMRITLAVAFVFIGMLAVACEQAPRNRAVGEWLLVSMVTDGAEVEVIDYLPDSALAEDPKRVYLRLDADVSGGSGCNIFRGQYEISRNEISIRLVTVTERACADAAMNEQEAKFFTVLADTATYERDGDELRLFDAGGNLLARFEK
jgi:heat shock protein HslJ